MNKLVLTLFACSLEARTKEVMQEFSKIYKQQYAVALFNSVRFEIEGGGGPQSQLLHRKASWTVVASKQHLPQQGSAEQQTYYRRILSLHFPARILLTNRANSEI